MQRLLRGAIGLWMALFVMVCAAIIANRAAPASTAIVLLNLSECELPCWLGIIPGKTTFAEATDRIQKFYSATSLRLTKITPTSFMIERPSSGDAVVVQFWISQNPSEVLLQRIDFSWNDNSFEAPTIGDMHLILGHPQFVQSLVVSPGQLLSLIAFPKVRVSAVIIRSACPPNGLWMDDRLSKLILFADTRAQELFVSGTQKWRGFNHCYPFMP